MRTAHRPLTPALPALRVLAAGAPMSLSTLALVPLLLVAPASVAAQATSAGDHLDSLVAAMTLEEKVAML
ncbi:MAG TPA: hypothetical protein VE173_12955, partial [Longimicrobiales bacterium]|nr:hypothetical protein [Longimicrobiales bacterium]